MASEASIGGEQGEPQARAKRGHRPTTNELPTGRSDEEACAARSGVSRNERQAVRSVSDMTAKTPSELNLFSRTPMRLNK